MSFFLRIVISTQIIAEGRIYPKFTVLCLVLVVEGKFLDQVLPGQLDMACVQCAVQGDLVQVQYLVHG